MKYKYVFSKESDTGRFLIRECAELSKDIFSTVCESSREIKQIEAAVAGGYEAILAGMRTQNFFPPSNFVEKIANGIVELINNDEQSVVEVYCDDTELLTKSLGGGHELFGKIDDDDDDDSDDFIDDDLPDDFDDDVKSGTSRVSVDIEDDMGEDEDD